MRYAAFRRLAERAYEEIPDAYKQGIDVLIVSRDAVRHPELPDVYTLGECLTESWPSDWQGPDTTRLFSPSVLGLLPEPCGERARLRLGG